MAKTNYSFEKRQRELAKKKKKEEKNQRKLDKGDELGGVTDDSLPEASVPADADEESGST